MNPTEELASRLTEVEREVDAIRRELAELEAKRFAPATELASRIAGRKVSDEELREIGRQKRAEFEARFGKLE